MALPVATLYLPLYFSTAWAMSNRNLADKLKYNLPLALRWQCPSIWHFWLYDLLFSALALPVVIVATNVAVERLLQDLPDTCQEQLAGVFFSFSYLMMGFFWPRVAAIRIAFGETETGKGSFSIGRLRDFFLGGPMVESVNANLQSEIDSYIDRVAEAMLASPSMFLPVLRQNGNPGGRAGMRLSHREADEIRAWILSRAETNFEQLYRQICRVEMIPLIDRHKPLMRVPQITFREEGALYESGIRSILGLSFCSHRAAHGLTPERFQALRRNARGLLTQRFKAAVSLACVFGCLVMVGSVSAKLTAQGSAIQPGVHRSNQTTDAEKGIYRP